MIRWALTQVILTVVLATLLEFALGLGSTAAYLAAVGLLFITYNILEIVRYARR